MVETVVGLLVPALPPDEYASDSARTELLAAMLREKRLTVAQIAAFFHVEESTAGYLLAIRAALIREELGQEE